MMEYDYMEIGDIAEVTKLAGFEFTKYIEYIDDGEVIALRALNLRQGELDLSDVKRIDRRVSDSLLRSKVYRDDILLTYTGNGYGDCAIIEENDKYHLAPNICKITPNTTKIDPYFLYSYIRTNEFYQTMSNHMTGSSQPTIPMKTIRLLKVPVPPMEEQKKIAYFMKNINIAIRNNKAINENLLQQAQALYNHSFPYTVSDILPEGWRLGTVSEIIEIHDSKRIPLSGAKRNNMEKKIYPYYGAASLMDYVDEYIFDGKYLLLGEDGTVVDDAGFPILQYVWGQFWVNNHAHILTGKLGYNVESLYMLFKQTPVKSIVTGAVQPKISQANLKSIPVVIPPANLIRAFNNQVNEIFALIRNIEEENKSLATLRDSLLPKLMSGEMDLSALDL